MRKIDELLQDIPLDELRGEHLTSAKTKNIPQIREKISPAAAALGIAAAAVAVCVAVSVLSGKDKLPMSDVNLKDTDIPAAESEDVNVNVGGDVNGGNSESLPADRAEKFTFKNILYLTESSSPDTEKQYDHHIRFITRDGGIYECDIAADEAFLDGFELCDDGLFEGITVSSVGLFPDSLLEKLIEYTGEIDLLPSSGNDTDNEQDQRLNITYTNTYCYVQTDGGVSAVHLRSEGDMTGVGWQDPDTEALNVQQAVSWYMNGLYSERYLTADGNIPGAADIADIKFSELSGDLFKGDYSMKYVNEGLVRPGYEMSNDELLPNIRYYFPVEVYNMPNMPSEPNVSEDSAEELPDPYPLVVEVETGGRISDGIYAGDTTDKIAAKYGPLMLEVNDRDSDGFFASDADYLVRMELNGHCWYIELLPDEEQKKELENGAENIGSMAVPTSMAWCIL